MSGSVIKRKLFLVMPPNKYLDFFLARKTSGEALAAAEKYFKEEWPRLKHRKYKLVEITVTEPIIEETND